jgi:hypothetical protein
MATKVRLLFVLALLVVALGCSGSKKGASATLTGKLTYNNQPITIGNMMFYSSGDAGAVAGFINSDGTYEAAGLAPGEYVVTVDTEPYNPANKRTYGGPQGESKSSRPKDVPATESKGSYLPIPAKYTSRDTSTLKVKVESGKQTKDINLTD